MAAEKWESVITASVPCSSANGPLAIPVPDSSLPEDYCALPPAAGPVLHRFHIGSTDIRKKN